MKKILSILIILTMLVSSGITVSAAEIPSQKEEVVYGMLNLDGTAHTLNVVNIFNGGSIVDYGTYTDISNMTTSEKLNRNNDEITLNTNSDKLYYQGTLENKNLPWDISIKYYLDNNEVSGDSLAGKSGKLKIAISVKQNAQINRSFYNNYALQISLSLDNKLCTNIVADNATIAEAGSQKQLAYTVLPGKGADITVTADVHDFEMDAITINGIKLTLGLEVDSDEFTGQIVELTDAIKGLDDGASDLLDGLNQLSSGMQKYMNGMKEFSDGIGQLNDGADQLNTGALGLSNGLSELTKQNDSIKNGASAIQQATFASVNAQLSAMNLGLPLLTPENYSEVLTPIPNLASVKEQLDGVVQFTQGLSGYLDGVSQLEQGASQLADGTTQFKASSDVIASSAKDLYNAGKELNDGIIKLRDGLSSYKAGTGELKEGTSDMDSEIDRKINDLLGSISGNGDPVVSFVSEKNTNVTSVQFVLKTNTITIPDEQKATTTEPAKLTFWQKILKLFGLYK